MYAYTIRCDILAKMIIIGSEGLIDGESCPREGGVGAGRYAVPASVRESPLAWTPQLQRTGVNPACYAYEVRSSGLIGFADFVL